MKIKAVLFDFIGTTIREKKHDVITRCLTKAFADNNIFVNPEFFSSIRGKDKHAIILNVLSKYNLPASMEPAINQSFKKNIAHNLDNFKAFDDAASIFDYLRKNNIKFGIGTGLSRDTFESILHHVRWNYENFNYIGISDEIGKSRPEPDMIFDMMKNLGIVDPKEVLKVGDTIADIQEGKNAGCLTAVVLSGTQEKEKLVKENPDFVLTSLTDILSLLS